MARRVRTGLESLLEDPAVVRGRRVGLVVNPSSITPGLAHASVALAGRRGVSVRALFGPEHGIAADAQDLVEVGHSRDRATGLPVYSLYGETRVPTPAMLEGVDAMVYDVQDVGARYYTFVYTMLHVMEAGARAGKRVVVLDRPNPLGGDVVDGNVLEPRYRSFVGLHTLAVRHGMTVRRARADVRRGARARRRPPRDPDAGLAPADALGGHRAALGAAVAEHADGRHGLRLPRGVPRRGDEPLGGARHDAAVRARGRAVARRPRARPRPRARADPRRGLPARRPSRRPSRSTRARCATACRCT